jgi:glycosyltransferase involved in cell wall biosynthesis
LDNPFKKEDVEILLATMNRNSLDFLIPMFPFSHFSNFSIVIINQTQIGNDLVSTFPSIRVINSYEKGLSKSRNLALENAKGKILLIADDDEVFLENFDSKMVEAYNKYPNSASITFEIEKEHGFKYRKYPVKETFLSNYLALFNCLSIEISLNKAVFNKLNISFDENFGLGSTFNMGEEAIFLVDIYNKKQQILFYPEVIAIHPSISTNDKLNFKERYYIQGAFLARLFKFGFYFQMATKLFFDLKQKKINFRQLPLAIIKAFEGKNKYRDNIK